MKMLWICVDAMDHTLVKRWMGQLPNIRKLTKESAWGMMVPEKPESASSWTTIFSGFGLKQHGVTSLDSQNMTIDSRVPLFWQYLSNAGTSVGVYRVPMTYPPEMLKGYMFSGWTAPYPAVNPNEEKFYEFLVDTTPKQREMPVYRTKVAAMMYIRAFEDEVVKAKKLFTENPVDVGIIFWNILDKIGHNVWELQWDRDEARKDRIKWYKRVDKEIGKMIKLLKPEKIVVCSDHGFNSREDSDTVWVPLGEMEKFEAWHTKEGFWLLKGDRVVPQEMDITNKDILPTVLRSLLLQTSPPMDGVVAEVFDFTYSPQEQAIVDKRLEKLGYK